MALWCDSDGGMKPQRWLISISYAACILFSYSLFAAQSVEGLRELAPSQGQQDGIMQIFDWARVDIDAPPNPDGDDVISSVVTDEQWEEEDENAKPVPPVDPRKIWAVLVAGSNGYENYRHQADVCHAYQILIRNGVPPEQIITFMYDDIANNPYNPRPGVIINRPNGPNVYKGVKIDYKGEDVNPDNFQRVILGDEEGQKGIGSGKVLKSGPDNHVFINFVDHGAPGLVAFPETELHAQELEAILKKMHRKKLYGKLVFYLESCESGSMFKNLLPTNIDIFATTAANSSEGSWACYKDMELQAYLGDVYSVKWMENADQANLDRETIQQQFQIVREETNTSHVLEFGDNRLKNLPVADFLGYSGKPLTLPEVELNAARSEDVFPNILQMRLAKTTDSGKRQQIKSQLKKLYKMRKLVTAQMMYIIEQVTGYGHNMATEDENSSTTNVDTPNEGLRRDILDSRYEISNFGCYERVARHFSNKCFSIAKNPYVTRKLYLFVNMCELGIDSEKIVNAMTNTCHHEGMVGIN